jgi:membrane-bound lytic murein transglycosylase A
MNGCIMNTLRLNSVFRLTTVLMAALMLTGCYKQKPEPTVLAPTPDYARQLGPGESALRLVTSPERLPNFRAAFDTCDRFQLDAMEHSLRWFEAPSSKQHFPFENISHDQAKASVKAMRELMASSTDGLAFERDTLRMFDVYESVGYNNQGTVLFTGYYAPVFKASRTRTPQFKFPLYKRPADLATDPLTGEPRGRQLASGQTAPYFTRREIEQTNMFAGNELVWLEDSLSAYIIHVNGSARLRMTDGTTLYIGYAGKTDRPYASLGKALVSRGTLPAGGVTMASIKQAYRTNPAVVEDAMMENESYVFFTEYAEDRWPSGSLGVKVTQESSLATDKKIYPRGGVVLVDTKAVTLSSGRRDFLRFMLDQDTGGAIQAPGRADMFMGEGPTAEILAGGQYAEGRLFYLFLKPEYVAQFIQPSAASASSHTAAAGK